MLFDNLDNLTKICNKKTDYKKRLEDLESFISNQYSVVDLHLEENLKKCKIKNQNFSENMKISLENIFKTILRNENHKKFFEELSENEISLLDKVVVIFYNYALKKINFDDIKYSLYLIYYKIDFSNFLGLSIVSLLSLLELSNKDIDIKKLSGYGNFYIQFINEVANNAFPDIEYAKFRGNIVLSIDECIETNDDIIISFEDGNELFFEKTQEDVVLVFESNNLDNPIAIVNNENEFLIGSFKVFDEFYNKNENIKNQYDGIDEIIAFYNKNNC